MSIFWWGFLAGAMVVGSAVVLAVVVPLRRKLSRERQAGYWPKASKVEEGPDGSGVYRSFAGPARNDLWEDTPATPVPQAPPVQGFVDHRRVIRAPRNRSGRE